MPYPQEIIDLGEKVKNWGRWGDDDERGTVNYITDEVIRGAVNSIRSGKRFSLAFPLKQQGGLQLGSMPGRINPLRTMIQLNTPVIGDPSLFVLAMMSLLWGFKPQHIGMGYVMPVGMGRFTEGVMQRQLHMTVHLSAELKDRNPNQQGCSIRYCRAIRCRGISGGHAITYDDCVNAEERQGVKVRSGDILLLRTGMMAKARNGDVISYGSGTPIEGSPMPGFPGVGLGAVEFFYEREVAAVATDTITFEVMPWDPAVPGAILPIHCINLVMMGLDTRAEL